MSWRYPEWFIGGPWHGKDKLVEAPDVRGPVQVAYIDPQRARDNLIADINSDFIARLDMPVFDQLTYVPQRYQLGDTTLVVWLLEDQVYRAFREPNSEASRLLRELIMAPHAVRISGNPQEEHERYQASMELQRRRLNAVYNDPFRQPGMHHNQRRSPQDAQELATLRQRVAELENELFRMATTARRDRDGLKDYDAESNGAAGYLDIRLPTELSNATPERNTTELRVEVTNIVCFFDRGNEGEEPMWIANAQGQSTGGSDHRPPLTGMGMDPTGAVMAVLADAVGYYARFTDIGERLR